ncbi:hypothetical protein [Tenacibaculum xiamenense]|uniref:hypothetical protein n=1 Tax=Tenacibaculum xiamenense TaxID=1261553 RepID=UPI00389593F9
MPLKVGRLVGKTVKFGIDTFTRLIDVVADFIKNIPKHIDTLKGWIDELIASLQAKVLVIDDLAYSVVDPITALGKLFVDMARKNAWKKLNNLGVSMLKSEDGLYVFYYDDKKLKEGLTQDQAEEFLKELFTKTKDKSDEAVKKYLDELSDRLKKIKNIISKVTP